MGRRSINTTKNGKYMNPTDQARKEARKRELRKNKKQRVIVRQAVLKGKDPFQIIADMERLDQMEYNVNTPPALNEKVLKDKRRKMKETWDRLIRLYIKEDHDKFLELKRMETEYENKRLQMMKYYESVKSAQEVDVDDIPLPNAMDLLGNTSSQSLEILPPFVPPQSILKKNYLSTQICTNKHPPGVPPGPPPVLSDVESDSEDEEEQEGMEKEKSKRIRFGDEQKSDDKEAEVDEFLKEIEQLDKSNAASSGQASGGQFAAGFHAGGMMLPNNMPPTLMTPNMPSQLPHSQTSQSTQAAPHQSMFMFRPPHGNVPSGVRPMHAPPPMNAMLPNRGSMPMRPGMSLPRMPPPMGPPRMLQSMKMGVGMHQSMNHPNPHLSGPLLSKHDSKKGATIEAKPQLRNLSADATRFTPVSLRVKREDKIAPKKSTKQDFNSDMRMYSGMSQSSMPSTSSSSGTATSKDDAYQQFMKEMSNLIQ